jgi:rhodanese-related sulfurtransferase
MDISAKDLRDRIAKGETLHIIDVREPYEYDEYNIRAVLIPLADLPEKLEDLKNIQHEEIILHCKSGNRSAAAKAFMNNNGFSNVKCLIGGITAYQNL